MGARGNIQITQKHNSETPIFFYAHWAGEQINEILALGLQRACTAGRINDPSYATRIIFDTLTKDAYDPDSGFGISIGSPDDNNYDIPHLVWPKDFGAEPTVELHNHVYTWKEYVSKFSELIQLSAVQAI